MKQSAKYPDVVAFFNAVNNYYRDHHTLVGCQGIPEAEARRMTANMKNSNAGYETPFPDWMIQQERMKMEAIHDDAV